MSARRNWDAPEEWCGCPSCSDLRRVRAGIERTNAVNGAIVVLAAILAALVSCVGLVQS